jgi:MFS transporter, DHA1 family, inner membrane transport protein
MNFFANRDINRLAVHTALTQVAFGLSTVFLAAFLLRAGLTPSEIFLVFAATLVLRFFIRLALPDLVRRIGFRNTFILGAVLCAGKYPILAAVDGSYVRLAWYILAEAVSGTLYWTCYHAFFAALGDPEARGAQVGARGLLSTIAAIAAPAIGGVLLASIGPWASFGAAALVSGLAILPLLSLHEPVVPPAPPKEAFQAVREGVWLFATDGFVTSIAAFTWDIISFVSFSERYDVFGGVLAAASVTGAIGGMAFGRLIDAGHGPRAVWINAAVLTIVLLIKSSCAYSPAAIAGATIVANLFSGFYLPVLMTAIYNDGKAAACTLRFHVMAEAGWDVGGSVGCLIAALAWSVGTPPALILLLALIGVVPQAWLATRRYRAHALGKGVSIYS